ncbi:Caspase domain-containing protein [Pseudonocardia ammonioxydans]|uniref:Caspase domain-containing protein n=1 Tax=Pseudonocardia ammonioxydans TaxID=260086 RepID=A0A1I5GNU3_PSUAM|nr:caspase family protein [Pseudonocardia ammonioxydans]SFO37643.1 Caspase domain-containing protein [Pseudonocardia ammonioxydans]
MKKRALCVGIDAYPGSPLTGCVNDASAIAEVLRKNEDGSPNFTVETLLGQSAADDISRPTLRSALARLFDNSRDKTLLFYFAGHGAKTPWGTELVTQDAVRDSLGVSVNDILVLANSSAALSITIILDCCFSGDLGNLTGLQEESTSEQFRIGRAILRDGVTILAASSPTETSDENDGHGLFTRILIDGLEGGASDHLGAITTLGLFGHAASSFDAWQQTPVLKTNVTTPTVLRTGPPWLDPNLLRDLPKHFPTEAHQLQLTPAHEGDGRPLPAGTTGSPEQQQFDYLGRLRNANLVTSDGKRDHYWLAMESGCVYLTPLGRYFWRLAAKGVL